MSSFEQPCANLERAGRADKHYSLALAELYIVIAYVFQRLDLELYETTRERDIDIVRDCFFGETSLQSKGVRVKLA